MNVDCNSIYSDYVAQLEPRFADMVVHGVTARSVAVPRYEVNHAHEQDNDVEQDQENGDENAAH